MQEYLRATFVLDVQAIVAVPKIAEMPPPLTYVAGIFQCES